MNAPFTPTEALTLVHRSGPVQTSVRVPGSKSLTNRYLLLAALASGESRILHPLESDDTIFMRAALKELGVEVTESEEGWIVAGTPVWSPPDEPLFVGNAGTVMRFLTPALALSAFETEITGNDRMLLRPIGDLVDGLSRLGAMIDYMGAEGYPPLSVMGPMKGGEVVIRGDSSSQYLSGLLMALPLLPDDSVIRVDGPLVSQTYVAMTLACMAQFGVTVQADEDYSRFEIAGGQSYQPREIVVEPDASTASYWFALPAMIGGSVTVADVPEHSTQGDFGLLSILEEMGMKITRESGKVTLESAPLHGVDVNMNTRSDVAPTLAVVAVMADSPTTIRDIGNMRIKECDRIDTLQKAFDALGLKMESGSDWMKIWPGTPEREAVLDPQEDHRMAMVFALLGLAFGGVSIKDPGCVAKTYPDFYRDMTRALTGA